MIVSRSRCVVTGPANDMDLAISHVEVEPSDKTNEWVEAAAAASGRTLVRLVLDGFGFHFRVSWK